MVAVVVVVSVLREDFCLKCLIDIMLSLCFRDQTAGELDEGSRGCCVFSVSPWFRALCHQHLLGHSSTLGFGHFSEKEETQRSPHCGNTKGFFFFNLWCWLGKRLTVIVVL